jgi:hypothetical protein
MVELQQFESLGGGGVKCHFLNIGVKSANEWIVQGGKMYFPFFLFFFFKKKN